MRLVEDELGNFDDARIITAHSDVVDRILCGLSDASDRMILDAEVGSTRLYHCVVSVSVSFLTPFC